MMQRFSIAPREMFASLWRHRELIKALAQREILGRYRGSAMGLLWSFFNPLLMLAVYTVVFGVIFKSRWPGGAESKAEFALVLFAGLIMFNLFAECVNRAPSLVLFNANYVKKVVFPLEILPFVVLLSALFHGVISLGVWLVAHVIFIGAPPITVFYFPLILLPFMILIMGLSWGLASLGVYLRDVGQVIGIATTILMFLSPVFFPATAVPEAYRHLLYMNPLTPIIEQTRVVLCFDGAPDFVLLVLYLFASIGIAWLGFVWFQKTRKGFADVL